MDTIKVVCGIIYKDEKVLLCRRSLHKMLGGYWEFPGGKVEEGESHQESLLRELNEELGMQVKVGAHFKTVIHPYDNNTIELISYVCQFQRADFMLVDHDAVEWVNVQDLIKKHLAPADIPIAVELVKNAQIFH